MGNDQAVQLLYAMANVLWLYFTFLSFEDKTYSYIYIYTTYIQYIYLNYIYIQYIYNLYTLREAISTADTLHNQQAATVATTAAHVVEIIF